VERSLLWLRSEFVGFDAPAALLLKRETLSLDALKRKEKPSQAREDHCRSIPALKISVITV
jgi:hypothetical protein